MRLLDLFSGTHSVGNVAHELGFDVVSLDLWDADVCCNVMDWEYSSYPVGYFDVVWASPPCDTFSLARYKNVGRNGVTRESIVRDREERGVPLLRRTMDIINYFKPKYYFIENPDSGAMKEYILDKPYYRVDYCMYGFPYRKRTRIWTNLSNFQPKLCNKNCGSFQDGKHMINCVGGNKTQKGQGSGSNRSDRYRIPALLVQELLSPIIVNDPIQFLEDYQQQ